MFSFTERTRPGGVTFNENYISSIDLNALDLCGIAVIGESFIFFGKSPLKIYSIPDMLGLIPLFLLIQQRNEKLLLLLKLTRGDPSSLPYEFLPWSNFGQYLQGTL